MASALLGRAGVFGVRPTGPQRASLAAPLRLQRGALQVVAAEPVAQNKKRTPQAEKRAQLAEERRQHNKSRKSACATRIRKVRERRAVRLGGIVGARVCEAPRASEHAKAARLRRRLIHGCSKSPLRPRIGRGAS